MVGRLDDVRFLVPHERRERGRDMPLHLLDEVGLVRSDESAHGVSFGSGGAIYLEDRIANDQRKRGVRDVLDRARPGVRVPDDARDERALV